MEKSYNNRPINTSLIFHSGRGIQYASYALKEQIEKYDVIQSMSKKANCWDNAVAENFFKTLKSEMIRQTAFRSILEARNEVFRFIEVWYNRKRKHSYLGSKTPEQYGEINYSKCA